MAVAGRTALWAAFLLGPAGCVLDLPGHSLEGPLPPLSEPEASLANELRADVEHLAGAIGERNVEHTHELNAAADFIETSLRKAGYRPQRQTYEVTPKPRGPRAGEPAPVACFNVEAELPGTSRPEEILVIGAHYDSVAGCPGADDNASGVAATLALARMFAARPQARTVRFVFFTNEEPPYFWTSRMGSLVYAKACRARGDNVVGMLSLETLGYHSEEEGSQDYPPPFSLFYPSTGNFIAFVGNTDSRDLTSKVVEAFRGEARYPSEAAAVPMIVPRVGSSDHWSFWKMGWQAVMVTDTAPYRYPHYHKPTDTPDRLDYERMARIVEGLGGVVEGLGTPE